MTPYQDVFDRFDSKITDYELDSLTESEQDDIKTQKMNSAIANYFSVKVDLSRDDATLTFDNDLPELVQEVIALYMVMEWLRPFKNNVDYLESYLNSREFKNFSPANKLKEVRETYKQAKLDASRLEIKYSYSNSMGGALG